MRVFVNTLMSLSLLSLCACSTAPVPPPQVLVKVVRAVPPKSMLEPCERPVKQPLQLTRDLLQARQDLETYLEICAAKMDRLGGWYSQPLDEQQSQPAVDVHVGPLPD